jgi:hypothetical protein
LYAVERNAGAFGPGRSLRDRKADRREAYLYGYTNPFIKVSLQVLSFKGRVKEKP